jgi:hypothetical protein
MASRQYKARLGKEVGIPDPRDHRLVISINGHQQVANDDYVVPLANLPPEVKGGIQTLSINADGNKIAISSGNEISISFKVDSSPPVQNSMAIPSERIGASNALLTDPQRWLKVVLEDGTEGRVPLYNIV